MIAVKKGCNATGVPHATHALGSLAPDTFSTRRAQALETRFALALPVWEAAERQMAQHWPLMAAP